MILEAAVKGFKRIQDHSFCLKKMTILAGLNGSGKTSLIQALLIAVEASLSRRNSVRLNGPFGMQLGTAIDVLNWKRQSPILLGLRTAEELAEWSFGIEDDDALFLPVLKRPVSLPFALSGNPRAFTYLDAERLGPRSILDTAALPEEEVEVGSRGENCAHILSVSGDKIIFDQTRSHPLYTDGEPRLLKYEVEQWLGEITRVIEVSGRRFAASTAAEVRFRTPGAEWVRAPNMGFGLTYALPIILAGLVAKSGGLFIVENPEAHLHPAGQSRMGVFLAWLAGKGVQVIIETHSDHVINGIRRAVSEYRYLDNDQAILHFFGRDNSDFTPGPISEITIDKAGSLLNWPVGLFDQYEIDVMALGRARRKTI